MTAVPRLVIFTRFPEPGKAKTRLIPALGADRAAAVHRRLTERALAAVAATGLAFEVRTTGAPLAAFRGWLGDLDFVDQGDGDLGARMARAVPGIVVGSDVPDMTAAHLLRAADLLARRDVVVGPAEDGGYWLVGMRRRVPELFDAMPWGTNAVLAETRRRAALHGIDLAETDTLADLDTPADLARWPEFSA